MYDERKTILILIHYSRRTSTDLLAGGVEVPVAPQLLHHLLLLGAELRRVDPGELLQGETPLVKTRSERHGTLVGVHLFH